jgi:hypothetical protein
MASDLAPRPRGGWQVGTSLRRHRLLTPEWMRDSDCYTVAPLDGRHVFSVRHFPDYETTRSCCHVKVTVRSGESDTDALRRAYLLIEHQHGFTPVRRSTARGSSRTTS